MRLLIELDDNCHPIAHFNVAEIGALVVEDVKGGFV